MSMRDRIAKTLDQSFGPFGDGIVDRMANTILATIKASVPELVWVRNGNHWAGGHGYVIRKIGSQYTLTIRNHHERQFDTLEAAQDVAQAHHVKQLTGWMMK